MPNSHIAIRPARASDQSTIRAMVRQAQLDPTGLVWRNFLIAENPTEIVGIGQIRPATPELGSLVVKPAHQNQGIGRELVRELLRQWEGKWPVYLECVTDMAPFYETLGFSTIQWYKAPFPLVVKSGVVNLVVGPLMGVRVAVMYIQSKASIL